MEMLREAPEVRKEQRLRKKKMARGSFPLSHSPLLVITKLKCFSPNLCQCSRFAGRRPGVDGAVLVVWCVAVLQEVRIVFCVVQERPVGHGASEQGRLAQIVKLARLLIVTG